jgi:6-pyruvoyltetrahydropterin/6-carboxytetrahydropterin synthase
LNQSQAIYRVELEKEHLIFSAAHFITFAGNICERLHGHNYRVRATVAGTLDENQYVIDFIALRDGLRSIIERLDHHMLLPTKHHSIHVAQVASEEFGEQIVVRYENRQWVFPAEDCILLPVKNTTAELLAKWIGEQVLAIADLTLSNLQWLEMAVDENEGQWAVCRFDLQSAP